MSTSAGRLASERLDDVNQAIELYGRAAARAHANVDIRRDALRELGRLHAKTRQPLALQPKLGEQYLALVEDPIRRVHLRRRLAETYELLGSYEQVVAHTKEILSFEPDDEATRERLDRALDAMSRHEERIERWTVEAARVGCLRPGRAEALVSAARIAEQELGDIARAESLFRAAWAADSGNMEAFDGLSRLLARPRHHAW